MKQICLSIVFVSLFVAFLKCSTNPIGGTGHDGEARTVVGHITDKDGGVISNTRVSLYPRDFNPTIYERSEKFDTLFDVTDAKGRFKIEKVRKGNYTLFARKSITVNANSKRLIAYNPYLQVGDTNIDIGNMTLKNTGMIVLDVKPSLVTSESYLYIPGTRLFNKLESSGINKMLAPAGDIQVAYYDKISAQSDTGVIIVGYTEIKENTTTDSSYVVFNKPQLPQLLDTIKPIVGVSLTFETGDCYYIVTSTKDTIRSIEYSFDWGDGGSSPWAKNVRASHVWNTPGHYQIKAQGRSTLEPSIISPFSDCITLIVLDSNQIDTNMVQRPIVPNGPDSISVGLKGIFTTGGSFYISSANDTTYTGIEYHYDWGDGGFSSWEYSDTGAHVWNISGPYSIRAQARYINLISSSPDSVFDTIISRWSDPFTVHVTDTIVDTLYKVGIPNGPMNLIVGRKGTYSSYWLDTTNVPDSASFRFDWGDGASSVWSFSRTAEHAWNRPGNYSIKAQARYLTDTVHFTDWSEALVIAVDSIIDTSAIDSVTMPDMPKVLNGNCIYPDSLHRVSTGSSRCITNDTTVDTSVEYRFDWGDGTISPWSLDSMIIHIWKADSINDTVVYIKAQARSWFDTSVASEWSQTAIIPVMVSPPTVSKPNVYSGDSTVDIWDTTFLVVGGSLSSQGDKVNYMIDWGDGSLSPWYVGNDSNQVYVTHQWSEARTFKIQALARSTIDTAVLSDWSDPIWVRVTDSIGSGIQITEQPVTPHNTIEGDSVWMQVKATGAPPLTYQWQKFVTDNWQPLPDGDKDFYEITSTVQNQSGQYRVAIWNDSSTIYSNIVTLKVFSRDSVGVTFSPANDTIIDGQRFLFSVGSKGFPPIRYQWQQNTGSGFFSIAGATDSVYSEYGRLAMNNNSYRCIVMIDNYKDTSNSAVLIVTEQQIPEFTTHPRNVTSREGERVVFRTKAKGVQTLNYAWEFMHKDSLAWQPILGAVNDSHVIDAAYVNESKEGQYRAFVSNTHGKDTSNVCTLQIMLDDTITINQQPQNDTVRVNEAYEFRIMATSANTISYQWQQRFGLQFENISGGISSTYSDTAQASDDGSWFRCVLSTGNFSDTSSVALLTVLQEQKKGSEKAKR